MTSQMEVKYPGARWWKFDFHAHTPASHQDYGKGPDQERLRQISPEEWLLSYMRAGIDCVAVTDHNSGDWLDTLNGALQQLESHPQYRPLVVFPGVELSVNGGVHLVAIFDLDKTAADITHLLGAAGYQGTRGTSDAVTSKSLLEVIQEIHRLDGLPIPAHVDQPNGLFRHLSGNSLTQILACPDVIAVEVFDRAYAKPALYAQHKTAWTEVLGTDAHHPCAPQNVTAEARYPGSHFTWVKMGQPNLEGLRLALLDGSPLSVRRSDEETGNPNRHTENLVESIEVKDARYCGLGTPLLAQFNPWLNAIIGGRGTGKSTIVEFLRIAMRRGEAQDLPERVRRDFEEFQKVPETREDRGGVRPDTQVRVVFRTATGRYRLQWDQRGVLPSLEEIGEDGTWRQARGDIRQRFPVRIFSQKQVFALAEESQGLLRVVDEATEVDRHAWEVRRRAEEARFMSLRAKARELMVQLGEAERLQGELDDVNRKLQLFEGAEHARVLKEYQRRQRQNRALREFGSSLGDIEQRLAEVADGFSPGDLDPSLFDAADPIDREILDRAASIVAMFQGFQSELNSVIARIRNTGNEWQSAVLVDSSWSRAFLDSTQVYESLVETLRGQGAGDPSQYGALVQKRQLLEGRLQALEETRRTLDEIRMQADQSLGYMLELRCELSHRRTTFLQAVLHENPHVRIELLRYGRSLREVEAQFRRLVRRDEDNAFDDDILSADDQKGLVAELYRNLPGASDAAAGEIDQRLVALKKDLMAAASGQAVRRFGKRFQTYLSKLSPETLDHIEAWFPDDSLAVSYSPGADGQAFRSIYQASPGQKTAAILAFLLSYGTEPMVIDQPEDDLDNHLIYDLIVRQVRENKLRRQLIVVTHNPNIVVNGDAELVFVMDQRDGQCRVVRQGCLQEAGVRDEVCRVMEGGREAFEQRYRRIAFGGSNV